MQIKITEDFEAFFYPGLSKKRPAKHLILQSSSGKKKENKGAIFLA